MASRKKRKTKKGKRIIPKKRKKIFKRIAKVHAVFTIIALVFYLGVGIFGGPEFLLKDIKNKYNALAANTTLSVRLVGPPGKPVVTATPNCSGTDPLVLLDWDPTSDTDNYDVYKGGVLLVSGITNDYYQDNNVSTETAYTYYVIANGPLGNTQSDDASATTGKCLPDPTCDITTIEGVPYSGIPELTDITTPTFTGTTNIPFADITIDIYSGPIISGTTTANLNGYWSWTVPTPLEYTTHTIFVTAADPADPTRTIQISKQFIIQTAEEEEEGGGGGNNGHHHKKTTATTVPAVPSPAVPTPAPTPVTPPPPVPPKPENVQIPLEFKISVTNPDKTAYAGDDLEFNLEVKKNEGSPATAEVEYAIIGPDGKTVKEWKEKIPLGENTQILSKKTTIPKLAKAGNYKITAKSQIGQMTISAEDSFQIKERPILKLGGTIVTWANLLGYLGWILFWLIIILLIWLLLLLIEHHLSKRAAFQITESYLERKGMISKRKGVLK